MFTWQHKGSATPFFHFFANTPGAAKPRKTDKTKKQDQTK